MNIKKIISAATAALISVASYAASYAGPKNDGKKKLEDENRRLLEVIDSLYMELDRYRTEPDLTDSLELTHHDVTWSWLSSSIYNVTDIPFYWLGFTTYLNE